MNVYLGINEVGVFRRREKANNDLVGTVHAMLFNGSLYNAEKVSAWTGSEFVPHITDKGTVVLRNEDEHIAEVRMGNVLYRVDKSGQWGVVVSIEEFGRRFIRLRKRGEDDA